MRISEIKILEKENANSRNIMVFLRKCKITSEWNIVIPEERGQKQDQKCIRDSDHVCNADNSEVLF